MYEKIKNFYDLNVWQKAHKLVLDIYIATKTFPKEELFGITNQIRRASASITANIAEGFGRYYTKDKIKFYFTARASLTEVQSFLILSKDLYYIDKKSFDLMMNESFFIAKQINCLISSLSEIKDTNS